MYESSILKLDAVAYAFIVYALALVINRYGAHNLILPELTNWDPLFYTPMFPEWLAFPLNASYIIIIWNRNRIEI